MTQPPATSLDLAPDCARCFGLCCVALPFARSADFPVDKAAGDPCDNLQPDFACGIHPHLRERGWRGCTVFDCFGAGQQVSQVTFGGISWREAPDTATEMYAVLPVMHQLHEMLTHLAEARGLGGGREESAQVDAVIQQLTALTAASAATLLATDLGALRARVAPLLRRASERTRQAMRRRHSIPVPPRRFRPGADLVGAPLAGLDLRTADLRGALLIAADLSGADLRHADLLGADLRGADLRGARLDRALYVTRPQLAAARTGDLPLRGDETHG